MAEEARLDRMDWLDRLKGAAMVWIFLNHAAEFYFGGSFFGNPVPGWPPLSERLHQLAPVAGSFTWTIFRDLGWLGDQAVGLFILAGGIGLGLSVSRDLRPVGLKDFYLRRMWRIFPLWWAVHLVVLFGFLIGFREDERASLLRILLSACGFRMGANMYRYVPAWWYFGLLLQLYAVFPALWKLVVKCGPWKLLLGSAILAAGTRGAAMVVQYHLDPVLRGCLFVTRLPEFVLGLAIAQALRNRPRALDEQLGSWRGFLVSAVVWMAGTAASFTWLGMTVAPLMTTMGAFGVLYPAIARASRRSWLTPLGWIGVHSYGIYLVHQTVVDFTLPPRMGARAAAFVPVAAALSVAAGVALERVVGAMESLGHRWFARTGARRMSLQAAGLATLLGILLVGCELLTRHYDRMELDGWGERASLEPDPEFGWKLKPSRTTRLRWESYDYKVVANELGFPGPLPPEQRQSGSLRILVTGDAFSSAEGVDTDRAWPRLLESELRRSMPGKPVEVVNFSITGYGPDQYVAVLRRQVPRFRPDLVVIVGYLNDLEDVMVSNEEFQDSIGFGRQDPDQPAMILKLSNLRSWVRQRIAEPALSRLRDQPPREAWFCGGFGYLERKPFPPEQDRRLGQRYLQIREICAASGAHLLVAPAPTSAQVCRPEQLPYWHRSLDLSDRERFDPDLPQKRIGAVLSGLGLTMVDLRPALRASPELPCQPRNLHWTIAGHRAVAGALLAHLIANREFLPADFR
jgi:peptidoglycan/LPS O-acetylase OafA/YrhL